MDQRLLLLLTCLLLTAIPSTLGPGQVHGGTVRRSQRDLRRMKLCCNWKPGACSLISLVYLCACDQFPFDLQSKICQCFCEEIRTMRDQGFGLNLIAQYLSEPVFRL